MKIISRELLAFLQEYYFDLRITEKEGEHENVLTVKPNDTGIHIIFYNTHIEAPDVEEAVKIIGRFLS